MSVVENISFYLVFSSTSVQLKSTNTDLRPICALETAFYTAPCSCCVTWHDTRFFLFLTLTCGEVFVALCLLPGVICACVSHIPQY